MINLKAFDRADQIRKEIKDIDRYIAQAQIISEDLSLRDGQVLTLEYTKKAGAEKPRGFAVLIDHAGNAYTIGQDAVSPESAISANTFTAEDLNAEISLDHQDALFFMHIYLQRLRSRKALLKKTLEEAVKNIL